MQETILLQRNTILVSRLRLAPGEATPWHRDVCHRVTVIVSGDVIAIEYHDGGVSQRFGVSPGLAEWDVPLARVHRAVNVGEQAYEQVSVFFLERPDTVPQPRVE